MMQQWGRIAVIAAMFVTSYLLILAWQKDYGQADANTKTAAVTQSQKEVLAPTNSDIPTATTATASDIPSTAAATGSSQGPLLEVKTDLYRVFIDLQGGDVVRTELLDHKYTMESDRPFVVLEKDKQRTYIAQSGLIGPNGPDQSPERQLYQVKKMKYDLNDAVTENGKKTLQVPLVYRDQNGVEIVKTFSFKQNEYPIHVSHKIINRSEQVWNGQMFGQLKRDNSDDPGKQSQGVFTLGTYLGGAWGTPDSHYNKIKFKDFNDEALNQNAKGGWVAVVQHYFLSAWVPDANYTAHFKTRVNDDGSNLITFLSPNIQVGPGKQYEVGATLYSGPKIQSKLKELAVGLNQTVDYGWLWPIAKLLFVGLQFFFGLVGNWGWAIVLLTILVKLILWPLSAKSYKSMAKMRVIAPEMQRMKEEFGEDKMRFSQEMMALYKREQVNPLSGCLPLLMQMPIFLALYWVLMESVELRHAPWMLWIQDLSAMDPWFILPLFMGATMYVQQMLNPQPTDPMQAKIFKFMPIIFTLFLLFFPAGLVLYWIVNNLFTIGQQWFINNKIEKESAARKADTA